MELLNKLFIGIFAVQISDLSAAISGGLSSPDFTSLGRALSLYIRIPRISVADIRHLTFYVAVEDITHLQNRVDFIISLP